MRKLNVIGKIILALGVLSTFRKVEVQGTFVGRFDNTWEIITISVILVTIGITLIFVSRKFN